MSIRDSIPADVKRRVLVEAGHRCAIPTCRATTTEVAHIVAWSKTHDNSFENLIALCPNDHSRYDLRREMDVEAMRMYKRNLGLLFGRYNDTERSLVDFFARALPEDDRDRHFLLGIGGDMLVANAERDGVFQRLPYKSMVFNVTHPDGTFIKQFPGGFLYYLTDAGMDLIRHYRDGTAV